MANNIETITALSLISMPSQEIKVTLGGQNCTIKIYQKKGSVYCDLAVDDTPIWCGAKCRTGVFIKPVNYMAFNGNLRFRDLTGNEEPDYTGFGDRWILEYVENT